MNNELTQHYLEEIVNYAMVIGSYDDAAIAVAESMKKRLIRNADAIVDEAMHILHKSGRIDRFNKGN